MINDFNEISNQENKYSTHNYKNELNKQLYYCSWRKTRNDIKEYLKLNPDDEPIWDSILTEPRHIKKHYKSFRFIAITTNIIIVFLTFFMCIYNNYFGFNKTIPAKLFAGFVLLIFVLGFYFLDKKMYIKDPKNPNMVIKFIKVVKLYFQMIFGAVLFYYAFLTIYNFFVNKNSDTLDMIPDIATYIFCFWLICTLMWGIELYQLKKFKSEKLTLSPKSSNYSSVIIFIVNCIFSIFTLILSVLGQTYLDQLRVDVGLISSFLLLISLRIVVINRSIVMNNRDDENLSRSPNSLVTFIILILSLIFLLLQNILAK